MLPNFLIIGAQKSGTTSIYNVLRLHPQIFFPQKKELNFFFKSIEYRKGIQYYENYFEAANGHKAYGEASPGYICNTDAVKRIYKHLPKCQLIACLRNPIDRAYSQYWDNRRQLTEWIDFDQAVKWYLSSDARIAHRGYFTRGFYYHQIFELLKYFPKEQILILLFDDLIAHPKNFYHSLFKFLKVDPYVPKLDFAEKSNPASGYNNPLFKFFLDHPEYNRFLNRVTRHLLRFGSTLLIQRPQMSLWARAQLNRLYLDSNSRLADLIGRDLSKWQ